MSDRAGRPPTFIVIGAMKAGTTSLWRYLRSHPQVFTPEQKELGYFIAEKNWRLGRDWYLANFAEAGDAIAVGEASPEYTLGHAYQGVPERMAALTPDAKLVYLLRDPLARLRSHYLERVRAGDETRPPERALAEHPGYVMASRYHWQLERYLEHYPREQILLVTSEDLQSSPELTLASVFAFLGVDPVWRPPPVSASTNTTGEVYLRDERVGRIRESPWYRAAARLTPGPLRRLHHRLTTTTMTTATLTISAGLEERIRDQLRPDVARLRAEMPEGFQGWGLA